MFFEINYVNRRKYTWVILILCIWPLFSFSQNRAKTNCPASQKQAYVWYFGEFAGIDFNSGSAVVVTNNDQLEILEANACISDSTGFFLLASGGKYNLDIFNRNLSPINFGYDLGGSVTATQSSLFIPRPENDYLFEVFFLNLPIDYPTFQNGLVHFTINLSNLSNPKLENEPDTLLNRISEGVSAVFHQNGEDAWVIVHGWESSEFYAYQITKDGLINSTNPVVSDLGVQRNGGPDNAIGTLKFSPDGRFVVYTFYNESLIELFRFDNTTGNLSFLSSKQIDQYVYGAEFSPNSNWLYITTMHIDAPVNFESKILQFDIQGLDPLGSSIEIVSNLNREMFCGLQQAPDGKIYVARSPDGNDYLGVINNPNRPGTACNFNTDNNQTNNGLYLGGRKSSYGLPNFNQSYFNIPNIQYDSNCYLDGTRFHLLNTSNIDSVKWEFNNSIISTAFEPVHTFPSHGEYLVKVVEYFNGISYIDSLLITINPLPEVKINDGKEMAVILSSEPAILDAGAGFQDYLWSTGETTQKIEVLENGIFSVEVWNERCCSQRDDIEVRVAKIFIPNAFLPESTGTDRLFNIADFDGVISRFNMRIYDKWGGLVFETSAKEQGWNGSGFNAGVYYYSMKIELIDGLELIKTGNVTLIR